MVDWAKAREARGARPFLPTVLGVVALGWDVARRREDMRRLLLFEGR